MGHTTLVTGPNYRYIEGSFINFITQLFNNITIAQNKPNFLGIISF